MQKRSFKFYRRNEADVMKSLGMEPTLNSGSTWIEKEDGQNEYLICQLKSTDAQSIKLNQKDLRILEKNASVAHKIPVFAIQFLNTDEVWILTKPEDLVNVAEVIESGMTKIDNNLFDVNCGKEDIIIKPTKKIGSSSNARSQFHQEKEKLFDKTKRAK